MASAAGPGRVKTLEPTAVQPAETGEVESLAAGVSLSLSALAAEFGISRDTVSRRLAAAGVTASGERRGHAIFRVGPAARAIIEADRGAATGETDPNKMAPSDRAQWFRSERDRLAVEKEQGLTVQAWDVTQQFAEVVKITAAHWEGLVDDAERTLGLAPDLLDRLEAMIDRRRAAWADALEQ